MKKGHVTSYNPDLGIGVVVDADDDDDDAARHHVRIDQIPDDLMGLKVGQTVHFDVDDDGKFDKINEVVEDVVESTAWES